ncbi:MAG TPA: tetratricopeptide repeat protein [Azospira sp.]|nr:tetratricopeptide repeat protein [Azospira sp.]
MSFPTSDKTQDADFSTRSFLVVDDFQGMRTMLRDILRNCGANTKNIVTAASGSEAVSQLASTPFDVVLCDYNLGKGKNGQQVLEEAKVRQLIGPACAWIVVTAEKTADVVSGAAEYQPDAYLLKPITEAMLRQRLARIWAKKEAFAEIDRAVRQGDLATAIERCDQRLRTDKANATDLLRTKCDLLLSAGDLVRAKQAFEAILAQRDVPWAKAGLARVLLQNGEHEAARSALEETLAVNATYLEAHDLMARTLQAMGDIAGAGAAIERAVRISPNSVTRQKSLGEVALRLGQPEAAEKAFRRSVTLGEHSILKTADAYLGLAKACAANGSPDEALRVLGQIDQTFDDETVRTHALAVEGMVHQQTGNSGKAREIASKLAAELGRQTADGGGQGDTRCTLDAARLLLAAGARDDAIALLQGEIRNSPDNQALLGEVRDIFSAAEMSDEGAELIESSRQDAIEQMNRGVLLVREGRHDEAIAAMRAARAAMPKNVRVLFNLTQVIVAKLQHDGGSADPALVAEARDSLAAANTLSPGETRHATLKAALDALAGQALARTTR